jgi:hypothetical protein
MKDLDGSWEIGLAEIQYPTHTVGITSKKERPGCWWTYYLK